MATFFDETATLVKQVSVHQSAKKNWRKKQKNIFHWNNRYSVKFSRETDHFRWRLEIKASTTLCFTMHFNTPAVLKIFDIDIEKPQGQFKILLPKW